MSRQENPHFSHEKKHKSASIVVGGSSLSDFKASDLPDLLRFMEDPMSVNDSVMWRLVDRRIEADHKRLDHEIEKSQLLSEGQMELDLFDTTEQTAPKSHNNIRYISRI